MAVVCAKHLQVPILDIQDLCTFFNNNSISSGKEQECANVIRVWLEDCRQNNRFCFDENEPTMYISSDADMNQMPVNEKMCMMRVKKSRVHMDNVYNAIGSRVKDMYGLELNETCHMGPEPSIYGNAIQSMITEWQPDFRQLYSNSLYSHTKHLNKLQSHAPQAPDWVDNDPPPFARIFAKKDAHGEIMSYALGINVWSLLVLVSLGVVTIHPHVVNDLSRNLLRQILQHAPVAATPGNICCIRSFNLITTKMQRIVLNNTNRPKHFLRPLGDVSFASTGNFAFAKSVGKFMPEDIMHCGFLFSLCKLFSCELLQLPGRLVQSEYELVSDTYYPVWDTCTRREGWIFASSRERVVTLCSDTVETDMNDLEWQDNLGDFIILPLIARAGACVRLANDCLGLITPLPGQTENYDKDKECYYYVSDESMTYHPMSAIDLVQHLLPVGLELYIDLRDSYFASKKGTIPRSVNDQYSLLTRLNVPTIANPPLDKIFVTYALLPKCTVSSNLVDEVHTLMVDVWKISLQPHHENPLTHLIY